MQSSDLPITLILSSTFGVLIGLLVDWLRSRRSNSDPRQSGREQSVHIRDVTQSGSGNSQKILSPTTINNRTINNNGTQDGENSAMAVGLVLLFCAVVIVVNYRLTIIPAIAGMAVTGYSTCLTLIWRRNQGGRTAGIVAIMGALALTLYALLQTFSVLDTSSVIAAIEALRSDGIRAISRISNGILFQLLFVVCALMLAVGGVFIAIREHLWFRTERPIVAGSLAPLVFSILSVLCATGTMQGLLLPPTA